jgi:hypothetical protein
MEKVGSLKIVELMVHPMTMLGIEGGAIWYPWQFSWISFLHKLEPLIFIKKIGLIISLQTNPICENHESSVIFAKHYQLTTFIIIFRIEIFLANFCGNVFYQTSLAYFLVVCCSTTNISHMWWKIG